MSVASDLKQSRIVKPNDKSYFEVIWSYKPMYKNFNIYLEYIKHEF